MLMLLVVVRILEMIKKKVVMMMKLYSAMWKLVLTVRLLMGSRGIKMKKEMKFQTTLERSTNLDRLSEIRKFLKGAYT